MKVAIEGLGANKSKKAITRTGKAMGVLSKVVDSFDYEAGVTVPSGKHSVKTMEKDIKIITERLMECDAFNPQTKLHHKSFRHLKSNMIKTLEEDVFKDWMVERFAIDLQRVPIPMESDLDSDSDEEQPLD